MLLGFACCVWLLSRLVADRARLMRGLETLNGRIVELQSAVDSVRHVFTSLQRRGP